MKPKLQGLKTMKVLGNGGPNQYLLYIPGVKPWVWRAIVAYEREA